MVQDDDGNCQFDGIAGSGGIGNSGDNGGRGWRGGGKSRNGREEEDGDTLMIRVELACTPDVQEEVKVPDSLYWLRFPDNPEHFADSVVAGWSPSKFLKVGCPSDSPWADGVLTALEERAKTDVWLRGRLADRLPGIRGFRCPAADVQRAEDWVVQWVKTEYASGAWFKDSYVANAGYELVAVLDVFSDSPEVEALSHTILCDERVVLSIREEANFNLPPEKRIPGIGDMEYGLLPVIGDALPAHCRGG